MIQTRARGFTATVSLAKQVVRSDIGPPAEYHTRASGEQAGAWRAEHWPIDQWQGDLNLEPSVSHP